LLNLPAKFHSILIY